TRNRPLPRRGRVRGRGPASTPPSFAFPTETRSARKYRWTAGPIRSPPRHKDTKALLPVLALWMFADAFVCWCLGVLVVKAPGGSVPPVASDRHRRAAVRGALVLQSLRGRVCPRLCSCSAVRRFCASGQEAPRVFRSAPARRASLPRGRDRNGSSGDQ